jgi:hypothetical protein
MGKGAKTIERCASSAKQNGRTSIEVKQNQKLAVYEPWVF